MRGLIAFLFLLLVILNAVNFWQIRQLRRDVEALQTQAREAEQKHTLLSDLMTQAAPLLAQAREAIQKADYAQARRLLSEAQARANQAGRTLGEHSEPALTWLRQQTQNLEKQLPKR
jgi:CHASE3 domain sensor protein